MYFNYFLLIVLNKKKSNLYYNSHRDAFLKGLSTGPKYPTDKGKRLIVVHISDQQRVLSMVVYCVFSQIKTQQITPMK
ncbi:Uncharacterized protein FWK35_00016321 [Aphis craccivora]|uniref:Uncharacterized protein n=1 Tax=Aphis craccivora TaxID=307492 RepID=A0A6G0ZJP5_APHCR|nr:Uncharacterized protein FWK35_00016321 [Aphis craccivora]